VSGHANPWNGKVVLQAFWWDCWNERYPQDCYTYLAKLTPRLRAMGFDGLWIPPPAKGNTGTNSMGYDLFVNHGPDRFRADPDTLPVRDYMANLVWAHQKLNLKDGAYKVRYQGPPDLLVIERSAKALIGLNDHGSETRSAWVQTDYGPNVRLHDDSGASSADLTTDQHGWMHVSVSPMSYAVWGRAGIQGGSSPPARRTTQEFQMADDLGDPSPASLGYGGRVVAGAYRMAGAVWTAAETAVRISVYTDQARDLDVRLYRPNTEGGKSRAEGSDQATGPADAQKPLVLEVDVEREGYHLIALRLTGTEAAPVRAYVKVEYQAPAVSGRF
jgi:alpha-amylase